MENNILGERIKLRRKQLKMSQTDLARLTGYSDKTAISKIENGINDLNQTKIVLFAKALRTTHQYLMGWIDDPSETLNSRDIQMLLRFRDLTDAQKDAVINFIDAMRK